MADAIFLTHEQEAKFLEGVIPANKHERRNFLQQWFPEPPNPFRTGRSVNFDIEFETNVTPAMHVLPRVDAPVINLQGFGSQELYFSYIKEGYNGPDIEEIDFRQIGQPFGTVDWFANYMENLKKKAALTLANIETRYEVIASSLITTGKYTAVSEYHPAVYYDFNRKVVTTDEEYVEGYVPQIDLTTLNGNGGVGKRAWGSSGGTAAPTPYKDFIKACSTVLRRNSIEACIMSDDVFDLFSADINANYKDAANVTYQVAARIELQILPMVKQFEDLGYRGSYQVSPGVYVDIYTYDCIWHDRTTGAKNKFIPNGSMVILPKKSSGIKLYGRIKHVGARFEPRRSFTNIWLDPKTKEPSAEMHVNCLMGHTDINSVVYWKVK